MKTSFNRVVANVVLVIFIALLVSCSTHNNFAEDDTVSFPDSVRVNQIQVLGTHNSYSKPIDKHVLDLIDPIFEKLSTTYMDRMSEDEKAKYQEYHPNSVKMSEGLCYSHPDFESQLNAGIRSLEIDIYHDPTGNRFNKPATYELMKVQGINGLLPIDTVKLATPGFKVMHIPDVDFRTHYTMLEDALNELRNWSDAHPDHVPVFIMVEAKDSGIPLFPNSAEVLPFTSKVFGELDSLVFSFIGKEKIITPDQVRGEFKTLDEAVKAQNWPRLKDSLGKFVFLLLPSAAGLSNDNPYIEDHPVLEDRAMFVQSEPGAPYAAFLLMDNAIIRYKDISEAVKEGYLVRTRSDIETYEAKVNDMRRANAAFESGAQVVSTDFYQPGNAYGTNYVVKLPGSNPARMNPLFPEK